MPQAFSKVIVIVLDGVGVGELPDAAAYGDAGSNTLAHIAARVPLKVPVLRSLGLDRVVDLGGPEPTATPRGAFGRMAELSAGKDSVTGHWEMVGIVLDRAFPVFPDGFPKDLIEEFEQRIGRTVLGNVAASGTEIIDRFGEEHLNTGQPIVYTSADSVFQIAAHEAVILPDDLYRLCQTAFEMCVTGLGVGRVIARPFMGMPGAFKRTSRRRDFAMKPTAETVLDRLLATYTPVAGVGKIHDLFAGKGVSHSTKTADDDEGMDAVLTQMFDMSFGLIFANLVDFDTVYGHRNDVEGFAANLEHFDARLGEVLDRLGEGDLLIVTADHGNDPTTESTDHAREYVPLLLAGSRVKAGVDLGTRTTFADLGQTIAEVFGVGAMPHGTSFLSDILGNS